MRRNGLEYLADKGEDIDEEEWELTAVQDVDDPDKEDEIVEAITSVSYEHLLLPMEMLRRDHQEMQECSRFVTDIQDH